MTAFVVNGGATTDWDTLTGGSVNATLDSYAISVGTTLRVNTDSYHCANHSVAFGSLDTVTFSGIGGKLLIDPTLVRVVAYTAGTGNVPAIGTSIVRGAASGALLGVWANWQSEPTAVGAAMPATGFIKMKSVTGGAFTSGACTGIAATASGADVQGWIEVRGADTATITVPRIGAFEVKQAWFELGTTNGARAQVLACPTTATVAGVFPGVWIETAAASNVYERFVGAGSIVAATTIPTDERGKIVWQTTAGIRIGSDGTNNVGFLPVTGCRVRIPAAILTCCTRTAGGSGLRVLPNATLATRQEFVTTSAGDISIDGAVFQWYGNFLQAYRADIKNSAVSDSLILQEIAAPINVDNVIVGPTQAQLNFALNMLSCFGGGTFQNVKLARFSLAASGAYVNQMFYNKGVTFSDVTSMSLLNRGNASTGTWTILLCDTCVWTGCTSIGGRMALNTALNCDIINSRYADNFSGVTGTANPHYGIEMYSGCVNTKVSGFDFMGLTDVHPYSGILGINSCYETTFRGVGTASAKLSMGSANASGLAVNGAGNNNGIRVQRVYTSNTRTGPWAFTNSDSEIELSNVAGDYADTSVLASLNTVCKGGTLLGDTTGQVSVYGTHWKDSFTSATVGKVEILCNEASPLSASQCSIVAGTPKFNSSGQVALTVLNDQVLWEMPYFALGHTALANLAATITGTNTGNLTYEFQCDKGAGYGGSWLTLNAANLTAQGAITPSTGFKLKVRAICAVANAGNLLTNIAIPTVTSTSAQNDNVYPLDTYTVTFTGLQTGTDVVVLTAGTSTILAQADANAGSSYVYSYFGAQTVDIGFIKSGYVPLYIRNLVVGTTNSSLPVAMTADRNFT